MRECMSVQEVSPKAVGRAAADVCNAGVCCPGGVSKALRYETWEWSRMFSSGHSCGSNDTAVIHGKPTGCVTSSVPSAILLLTE